LSGYIATKAYIDNQKKKTFKLHMSSQYGKPGQLECGPMLNVMAALPNIGGDLCSTPQSVANAQYSSAVQ